MKRGFETAEYQARLTRAQSKMAQAGLAALLLTTEADFRYFSGFLTRFWESPTRPWFLIVPVIGNPIAVIPIIGEALMRKTWITDIRTWSSPDLKDDGISLLAETLRECCGPTGPIGMPFGPETHLRMPMTEFKRLEEALTPDQIAHDYGILRALRMIKSDAEVEKIRHVCSVADRAFQRVPEIAYSGVPLDTVFRKFQMLCLDEGADWVPYLAGAADQNGYSDVISPATSKPLIDGDVLMLDTGAVRDGYFCDFDRNFAVGTPSDIVVDGHKKLIEAVQLAVQTARPGHRASDLFHLMANIVSECDGPSSSGRLGHGLGMQLTEWPSLMAGDETVLQIGMVLTLEPVITLRNGKILVHEENVLLTEEGCTFLSDFDPALRVLS